ncbi:UDP-N-acetylglucosamine 2-epimerase (non-hydrolyzing) [Candidatus Babeliales bacterium]|nr:UDP-N-acetylglucosamine 2-epimerase (non-hydrolyzing) [Candidatus Babeliales bacterium]
MKKPVVVVVGTRPGAIKSMPVYLALKKAGIPTILCATFQHDSLLQQVFDLFDVKPDIKLNIMKKDQDLFYLTATILEKLKIVFQELNPELVLVHGDTTTAFAAALAAFYFKIPIGHLEAGLRTGNKFSPFPEEINRKFISNVATYHFAPTALNVANLLAEGVAREGIFCTGNVIVDALNAIRERIDSQQIPIDPAIQQKLALCQEKSLKPILLTAHRRESFDGGLVRIFKTVKKFGQQHKDLFIFYPFHPNPNVLAALEASGLKELENIYCCPPLEYKDLIHLIVSVNWVMTDSGGIQEEAISVGKKVLILRDITERIEGVWEGHALLVGTDEALIAQGMANYYTAQPDKMVPTFIYGDGNACQRIVTIIKTTILQHNDIQKKQTLKNSNVVL